MVTYLGIPLFVKRERENLFENLSGPKTKAVPKAVTYFGSYVLERSGINQGKTNEEDILWRKRCTRLVIMVIKGCVLHPTRMIRALNVRIESTHSLWI